MALNSSRSTSRLTSHVLRLSQPCSRQQLSLPSRASRLFSISATRPVEDKFQAMEQQSKLQERAKADDRPRWSYTPEGMKAPFSPHEVKNEKRRIWHVNSEPARLDKMYIDFLGRDGDKLLPDEVKWLAITHKSFDQGRRGNNDRLAYLGRQLVVFEITEYILASAPKGDVIVPDEHNREPFRHPQLDRADHLNTRLPNDVATREALANLAMEVGLDKVLRWKPRMPDNLAGSGIQVVLNGAIHAIFGAITLQHGPAAAGKLIRERVVKKIVHGSW